MSENKKPILFGDPTPEIAKAAARDRMVLDEFGGSPFYIPGYSELVKANAISQGVRNPDGSGLSEDDKRKYYQRFGTSPRPLPYHFVNVRVQGPGGNYSQQATIEADQWRRRGYRPVEASDFEEGGYLAQAGFDKPPAMEETQDGHFHAWDTELWVVDGDRHRLNEAEKQRRADAAERDEPVPASFGVGDYAVDTTSERVQTNKSLSYSPNV